MNEAAIINVRFFIVIVLFVIFLIISFSFVSWVIKTSNRFKIMKVKIGEADAGIGVALQKRYDTLTKLMQTVKAYAKHEIDTLTKMVELRQGLSGASIAEKADYAHKLDSAASQIQVVAESYPELRSSDNYRQFQDAILDSEDHLQAARRLYNNNVSSYNQAIVVFPASIIANMSHMTPLAFFEIEETRRQDVAIDL
jgi:LemA protein